MTEGTERGWIPEGLLVDRPNPARIYDYLVGGFHNFAADREMAHTLERVYPQMRIGTVAHRAFVRRAVKFLVDQGIDQFLDLGSGLPTAGNVHHAAQAVDPDAHVVYVDNDPVVLAHSELMLHEDPHTTLICEDLRNTEAILQHEAVVDLLDLGRPLAVMCNAVLHYILDDAVAQASIGDLRDRLVPGSYVVISHACLDGGSRDVVERVKELYRSTADLRVRRLEQVQQFFAGLELVEPGLVRAPEWRPEGPDDVLLDQPQHYLGFVGVGRKV
jgi:hypothetical protein